ncbi:MAG: hypothetical protein OEY59_02955 [Deltaproteobacteria bacterium]|nr:hypothetical protein [Deltaproteobacteria bacterium]
MKSFVKGLVRILILILLLILVMAPLARAGEWGVNLYGLSYHETRTYTDSSGNRRHWNETNFGLGLNQVFFRYKGGSLFHEEATYIDSKRRSQFYFMVGVKYEFLKNIELGTAAGRMATYNREVDVVGVLMVLSYHYRSVIFHLAAPPINRQAVALYMTIKLD